MSKKIYGFKIECDMGQTLGRVCHWRFYTGTLWINVCFGSFENLSKMHAIVCDVSVKCQMTIFHSNSFMNESRAMSSKRLWTFLPDYLLFWAKGNHIKTIDHSWVGFRWELLVIFLSSVNQHFLKDRLWSGKEGGALACVCVEGNC